ncbi:MAG: crossover junction endodeoxyribonuclease RuvC [Candidatus Nealsonbacteria bacterium]|nr:crossover junction endodeoxyribonuclease RuvC [Candidatus Nealsonbacteria bacterium]
MIILGIDPGTATTGYGVVRHSKITECLDYGLIQTSPSLTPAERLMVLSNKLDKIIKKYKPDVLAVENLYFFKNLKTALPVSQAKGVILLAAAKNSVPVQEFTPLQVKMGITGYGRAEKKQIQKMVQSLLCLKDMPKPDDAADALALAICCGKMVKGVDRPF